MKPAEALAWFETHRRECAHIRERRPCRHEIEVDCAVCGKPYIERGHWLTLRHGTTCLVCCGVTIETEA